MTITVPKLPYAKDALAPHMSERTVTFHYDKHHKGYAKKLDDAIEGTAFAKLPLEEIIRRAERDPKLAAVFNNGAQVWNHTFFWEGMTPDAPGTPGGELAERLDADLGGLDAFGEAFVKSGESRFGSGYVWLVLDDGRLKVMSTANAETPLTGAAAPLLCCDVWEHAYYLDVQNERGKFLKAFVAHLIDWNKVSERFEAARQAYRDMEKRPVQLRR